MKMYSAVHSVLLMNRNVRPKEEMRRIKFSEVGCVITLPLCEASGATRLQLEAGVGWERPELIRKKGIPQCF